MKPESNFKNQTIEQLPVQYLPNVEKKSVFNNPEVNGNRSEKDSKTAEINSIINDVNATTILPLPVVDVNSVAYGTTVSDVPLIAGDDDLIEKEWVDRAKKIVAETQNNPHLQEKEVSLLQIDYLKKRYGRELGEAA